MTSIRYAPIQIPAMPRRARAILAVVCHRNRLDLWELYQSGTGTRLTQKRRIVAARHDAARALHAVGYALKEIGSFLGVHHTSVLHALKKPQEPYIPEPIPDIDLSGEWAI